MSWDNARKEANDAQSGGMFLRLKADGDSAKVVFRGEPLGYKQVWLGDESEIYDEKKHAGERPRQRFRLNVYNTDSKGVQIFEMSASTLSAIDAAVNGERDSAGKVDPDVPGNGLRAIYKITRRGTGTKTTYSVNYLRDLTDAQVDKMDALEVHNLDPSPSADVDAPTDDEDIPF